MKNYIERRKATKATKAVNKTDNNIYVVGEHRAGFLKWLEKKEHYRKVEFNDAEKFVLGTLDRIKKIKRAGSLRIYQFISSWQNKSFYLILQGYGGKIEVEKNHPGEL